MDILFYEMNGVIVFTYICVTIKVFPRSINILVITNIEDLVKGKLVQHYNCTIGWNNVFSRYVWPARPEPPCWSDRCLCLTRYVAGLT